MKLSLVVPCYNEEGNIALFYKAVADTFEGHDFDYEIVFVNDGSTDGTLNVLKKLVTGPAAIKIISFSRNFGKEAAMLAGLENADGEYVTVIDADLQQHPSVVLDMIEKLDVNPEIDCVAAYQGERNEDAKMSFFKDTFYKVVNLITDTEFVSGASDFRTFRRPMVDSIVKMKEYFRFSKGIFSWVGYNTEYIPYTVNKRANGESKWSFFKLFRYALDGIESFTTRPLRLPLWLGILFIIISLLLFVISLATGKSAAVSAVFFVGGTILGCMGILGEYLAKTYIQGKGRPIYIVKEKISNR